MRGPRSTVIAWMLLGGASMAQSADGPRAPGTAFQDCDDCPEMVVITAGSFVMGTPGAHSAGGVQAAEAQAVVISLPRHFAIGRFEVTRRQFARFIADSGHEPRSGCRGWDPALQRFSEDTRRGWQNPATPAVPQDDHPVTCVSFADAQAYVQWLARETGERYRLPSEAEWEYAARAGSTSLRPWGDDPAAGCDHANTYDLVGDASLKLGWAHAACRDGYTDLAPVGKFSANAFGVHDVIGNVREWVQDCAGGSYTGRPRDARAWEWLGGCRNRVQRGGSWLAPPAENRSAWRGDAPAGLQTDDGGFRVARDIDARASGAEER